MAKRRYFPASETKREVLSVLRRTSRRRPLTTAAIAKRVGIVRDYAIHVVTQLRQEGYPIASSMRDGHFYARQKEDLLETINRMERRRRTLNRVIAGLKRAAQAL